jgi:glyoxylase-like metal-dependent hydrolase (beta-lactamase superfamily II)
MGDFPLVVEGPVYYCGFNSPKSYGGNSYFIQHAEGNWLVDSPKFQKSLVKRLEELGGVRRIFLTHRDDVAEAARFAEHFGAERIIDRRELSSQPGAERVLEGDEPTRLAEDFLAIPTPGHTGGHLCLLFQNRFLFTGDHLAWDRDNHELEAYRDYCWHSWTLQKASMARLIEHPFEWILPGHGQRVHLPQEKMTRELQALLAKM